MSYYSWRESTVNFDIILQQAITSIISSLSSLESSNEENIAPLQAALTALCMEYMIKDTHMMLGHLLSLKVKSRTCTFLNYTVYAFIISF